MFCRAPGPKGPTRPASNRPPVSLRPPILGQDSTPGRRGLSPIEVAEKRDAPCELPGVRDALRRHQDPPTLARYAKVGIVNLGGDADTNGACAGGLLGVRDGADAVPARWVIGADPSNGVRLNIRTSDRLDSMGAHEGESN